VVSKYGKVLIWKINTSIWFQNKEEEEINGRYKENTRHRGSTLIGTPKGTPHW